MRRPARLALWTLLFLGAAWAGRAQAAVIFFAEDPAEVAPIAVSTDLAGASLASTPGQASVSLGTLSGASNLLLDIALVQPGTQEQTGGGKGVADILQLLSFVSAGQVVGFEALYLSDKGGPGLPNPGFPTHPTFCSTMPVNEPACAPGQPNSEFVKTGALMSFFENVPLPGTSGPTALKVEIQSPLQSVPEPSALVLFASGLLAALALTRSRSSP